MIRGTPLLLQLYFLFFILPEVGPCSKLDPGFDRDPRAGDQLLGLRGGELPGRLARHPEGADGSGAGAGHDAVDGAPPVIIPQAMRIVIPPVTNDFIALFKDTSVCSVILITELTRKYNELYNFNRDLVVELAFITAGLYLLMSYPMSLLARVAGERMGTPRRRSTPMIRVSNLVKYHGDAAFSMVSRSRSRKGRSRRHRAVGRRQEHAPALHQRAGSVPGRRGSRRRRVKLTGGARRREATLLQLRRTVGMVFQQFNLFPHMTVLQNVMSGPVYALGKLADEAEATAKNCWRASGWPTSSTPTRANFPAGSSSVLRSPGPLRLTPRRSCSTSRPAPSTRRWPPRS